MFGNGMMKKFQEMQKQVEAATERLSQMVIQGESGGVTVNVDGNSQVKEVKGGEGMSHVELLGHVKIASNRALEQAAKAKEIEMAQSAKGILPGM
jgi:DNA-binding protein YbaB